MLEIKLLSKQFKQKKRITQVLSNINLSISQGKMVALTGENGSGKTTLLRILGGELLPDSGTITVDQTPLQQALQKSKIHLVSSEDRGFYYRLSPLENLTFFTGLSGRSVDQKALETALKFTGLFTQKNDPYYTLSTGMKQRLGFARGMLLNADILLLDELDRGIDQHHLQKLFEWLKEQSNSNKTVMFATHRQALIDLADEVIQLKGLEDHEVT